MRQKVVLVNAHWSNRGDEAAVSAILKTICKIVPEAEIQVVIKDDKEIKGKRLEERKISYESNKFLPQQGDYILQLFSNGKFGKSKSMKRYIEILKDADYIAYAPGGSVINDRFWWRKQLEYMLPFFYARIYNKPLFVAAPSVGPFEKKYRVRNAIRRVAFNSTKYFLVREEMSQKYLAQIGVTKHVQQTIDSAFCVDIDTVLQHQKLTVDTELNTFLERYSTVVGVTLTELEWNVKYRQNEKLATQIRNAWSAFLKMLKDENIGVVFIPQLFGNQNDSELLKMYSGENTFILDENYDSDFQQYIISKMHMVIGMRYHSNIFAAKMSVPFLPIIYEEKMESFAINAGLEQYALCVEEISCDNLYTKFIDIERDYEVYKQYLIQMNIEWRKKAQHTIDMLSDFLRMNVSGDEDEVETK